MCLIHFLHFVFKGLKLETRDSGLQTGDSAGFTLIDTLAYGTVGHIIGAGVGLGLKNMALLSLSLSLLHLRTP